MSDKILYKKVARYRGKSSVNVEIRSRANELS